MSYCLQMRWISGQYVEGGTMTPPAPCTGSPMKAATLSGPIPRIFVSSVRAAFSPNSSGVMSRPNSYQCGCSTCTMLGIGSPPCACMPDMPDSDAPAIVEPW